MPAPRQQIERQRRPEELDALAKELSNLGTQCDVTRHMMWSYCVRGTASITSCMVRVFCCQVPRSQVWLMTTAMTKSCRVQLMAQ